MQSIAGTLKHCLYELFRHDCKKIPKCIPVFRYLEANIINELYNLQVEPVKSPVPVKLDTVLVTDEQKILFESLGIGKKRKTVTAEERNEKLKNLLNKMEDLKIAAEQIQRQKYSEFNRLLRD